MPTPLRLVLAMLAPAVLAAQAGPDRSFADQLLRELEHAHAAPDIPAPTYCDPVSGPSRRLCLGLLALKRGELTTSTDEAVAAEFQFRQVVVERPDWTLGWYGLGVARLQLARGRVIAKEGPRQPLGASLELGAGNALVRALELDSTFAPALTALALAPIPRDPPPQLMGRLIMLRRLRAQLGPAGESAVALLERTVGSRDSAVALGMRTLQSGRIDSAIVSLELARDLHATGRAAEGRELLFASANSSSDAGQAAYRHGLAWVANAEELASWDSIPPADRPSWLRKFWGLRDLEAGWPEGTRLAEHYLRVEQAWKHFSMYLPPSGRHRMATRSYGIDNFVDYLLMKRLLGPEGLSTETGTNLQSGGSGLAPTPSLMMQDIRLMAEQMKALGPSGPFSVFRTSQQELDDRGVVWIRYGEPDKRARSSGGEALEVWAYTDVEPPLVLQFRETNFDGQVGASMLVPTLIDVPGRYRDQFCGIEQSLCTAHTNSIDDVEQGYDDSAPLTDNRMRGLAPVLTDGGRLNAPVISRVVSEGRERIERATTTDAHQRTFASRIDPIVQVHGVTTGASGVPQLLVVFALPGDRLTGKQRPEAGNRLVYPVRFVLSVMDADGMRIDLDTTRNFVVREALTRGQFISGTLEMPMSPGRYSVSLLTEQADGPGAVASIGTVSVPGSMERAWMSSLVLGLEGSRVTWSSGAAIVPLHPQNAFPQRRDVEVYYQVGGLHPGETYRTTVEILGTRGSDAPEAEARVRVAFSDEAASTRMEVQRRIGVGNLEPGRYRVRVTVTGNGVNVAQTALMTVVGGN